MVETPLWMAAEVMTNEVWILLQIFGPWDAWLLKSRRGGLLVKTKFIIYWLEFRRFLVEMRSHPFISWNFVKSSSDKCVCSPSSILDIATFEED